MKLAITEVLSLGLTGLTAFSANLAAEEEAGAILYQSPKGTYRIQFVTGKDEPFIVSTKNPAERAALPDATADDPEECQLHFYSSPDEKWIFYTEHWRHHGVVKQELYALKNGVKFEPFRVKQWFAQAAQSYAVKRGGFRKTDFLEKRGADVYENHLRMKFRGWSSDSSRLLIGIYGEAAQRDDMPEPFYVYFNARTKALEQTPYLQELNKIIVKLAPNYPDDVVCAEPTDPLPPEMELKARFEAAEQKLNGIHAARIAALNKEEADELRAKQQAWIKARDEGVKTYLASAPKGGERRRLQFLGDVTAARIEEPPGDDN